MKAAYQQSKQYVCLRRQERVWQELSEAHLAKLVVPVGLTQQHFLDGPSTWTGLHDPTPSGPADLPNLILSQFLLKRVKLVWDGRSLSSQEELIYSA